MCGIVGILARNGHVPADVLERATQSLAHRGPDDSGTTIICQTAPSQALEVGLGARRLAILDLSPLGHQPMQDSGTGNWIVYNGEIYNFREVGEELRERNVHFVSNSDTEVILKAYGYWGEECLKRLRGIFAFAIWDAQRKSLFLARDPMGVKPLYYYASKNYFLFASEVRTLLGTGLVDRRFDPVGLIHYLGFGSLYDPTTVVEGIAALRPGHFLVWRDGIVRDEEYWDLIDASSGRTRQFETKSQAARLNAAAEIGQELRDAVSGQLVSDVPVGVFLSGGIDSSSLVALLSAEGARASTFSLVFREDEFNEAEFSRAVAQRFRSDHHEIAVSQRDALSALPDALRAMDQPTIDGLNTYVISRHAHEAGVKVALSGLGGDEIFAGYSSFRTVVQMEKFVHYWHLVPAALRRSLSNAFDLLTPSSDENRKLFALAHENGSLVHPYFLSRALFTGHSRARLYPAASEQAAERANAPLRQSLERTQALDPVNRVSYLEARCYMLNTLLRDSDVMSMAHGLEVRVPFLDPLLVRKIFSLPGSWKLDAAVPKPLLVGALANALPDQIVRRKKRGFTLPFQHWLRDELRASVESTLRKIPEGPLGAILNAEAVQRVWQDFLGGNTSWSRPWSLYVLQRWSEINLC
jgi:asparagine synthase (glutamine-hydrolysing)